MAFASLNQLKSLVWDTRDECEKALKRGGFKTETATYRPSQNDSGRWYLEEIDLDASQEAPEPIPAKLTKPAKAKAKTTKPAASADVSDKSWPDPTTANKWLASNPQPGLIVCFDADKAVYRLRPVGTTPAMTAAKAPAKAPEAPAKTPAKTPAAAKPKPAKTLGKSSDPSPDELPPGFDDWLIEMAFRNEGLLRTEINARLGVTRRWMNHLKELAKQHGFTASMQRDGRYTRFFLKKA